MARIFVRKDSPCFPIELLLIFHLRYGMVLAKEKNDKKALGYFLQSVHKFPMNWGCWLEITSLTSRVEDVCAAESMVHHKC